MAIVGASANEPVRGWLARQLLFGYEGTLYPVNPRAAEVNGLKAYPTVRDIPGPVDYAIFNIPARFVPQALEDCAYKRVKLVHLYTAGFSETGKEEGKKLEARVAAIAREGGIRLIGPNCLGLYYPNQGITFNAGFAREPGNLALLSQSGSAANRFISLANQRQVYFSKGISFGNAIDLEAADYMEYFAQDPETEIIACYLEGMRDGKRFLNAVRQCMVSKPVIIMKAGLTEGGAGAAASHTASLGGSRAVWEALFNQTGVIRSGSLEEMVDISLAWLFLKRPLGRRVGVVGRGGGIGVIATDTCELAGLKVPAFLPGTRQQFESIIPEVGAGTRNPVESDRGIAGMAEFFAKGLPIVDADPNIDFIMVHISVDIYGGRQASIEQEVVKAADSLVVTSQSLRKPVVVVLYPGERLEPIAAVLKARERLVAAKIPVFNTIQAAAVAVSKLIGYRERRSCA